MGKGPQYVIMFSFTVHAVSVSSPALSFAIDFFFYEEKNSLVPNISFG